MKIAKSLIYTSAMPVYVYVQLKGAAAPAKIKAESVVEDDYLGLLVKDSAGKQIGKFDQNNVIGWWVQEEDDPNVINYKGL